MRPWLNIHGHMFDNECLFLNKIAADKKVLEIGTHHGRSTAAMAESAYHVTTIDTYLGDPQIGAPNLEVTIENLSGFDNIDIIVDNWKDITILPSDYNMIFYDGCHTEEWEFFQLLRHYKGILAVHDYKPKEPEMAHVVEAVHEYAELTNRTILFGEGSIVWFDQL